MRTREGKELTMEKPTGGIDEYDLLNRMVTPADDPEVVDRTLAVADQTPWGLGRCRMAAIIEREANRKAWRGDFERRAVLTAKYFTKRTNDEAPISQRHGQDSTTFNDMGSGGTKTRSECFDKTSGILAGKI